MENNENLKTNIDKIGKYANYFRVGHNAFEFVVDMGQLYEGDKKANFHTRIITSPEYIIKLLEVIEDSVKSFDDKYS